MNLFLKQFKRNKESFVFLLTAIVLIRPSLITEYASSKMYSQHPLPS
jgi:hypothetical protein